MQKRSLYGRVRTVIAVIAFLVAMLIGAGAPAEFVDVPQPPTTTPTQQPVRT